MSATKAAIRIATGIARRVTAHQGEPQEGKSLSIQTVILIATVVAVVVLRIVALIISCIEILLATLTATLIATLKDRPQGF